MRGPGPVAAVLALIGVFSLGLSLGHLTDGQLLLPDWLPWRSASEPGDALSPSRPTRIAIPSLSVDAKIRPVGLAENGAIDAPSLRRADEVGWYEDGPTPGQTGPAVLVGHVDDRDGPAVFHQVGELRHGDRIEVSRRDRRVAVFEVTGVRRYAKTALPVDEVYGDFRTPELRLISCGGAWVGGEVGYADNVVVFATLVKE